MPSIRPTGIIGVKKSNYQGVVDLATQVVADMTAAAATFTAPLPLLATITGDIATASAAIAAWGPVHNRGSHADLLNLRAAIDVLYVDLLEELAYVMNTCQIAEPTNYSAQAALILSSGFAIKNNPAPQGVLAQPNNLHRVFDVMTPLYTPKLRWEKPLGLTSPGNVKMYGIYRATVDNFNAATRIGSSTKTQFVDTTAPLGATLFYWVVGINTAGNGAESMVLNTSTPVS